MLVEEQIHKSVLKFGFSSEWRMVAWPSNAPIGNCICISRPEPKGAKVGSKVG